MGAPMFAPLVSDAPPGRRAWSIFGFWPDGATRRGDLATARSLNEWHSTHPFCARCGAPSAPFRAGWGRQCGACNAEHFPRVDPVVIMLASMRGGRWSAASIISAGPLFGAGRFVEHGESIEEAVQRELFEGSGRLVAAEVRYVASQPSPFRDR